MRYITIGTAGFGAVMLIIHLIDKLVAGSGSVNAADATAILALAITTHVIGGRQ